MKMKELEIFDYRLEYFKVIYWGFSPPSHELLQKNRPRKKIDIIENTGPKIREVLESKDEEKINDLKEFIKQRYEAEEDRKKTIENKAHLMIGQTSITVSLLLAAISFGSKEIGLLPLEWKILFWIALCILILNFVTVGLHARNAVRLRPGYAAPLIDVYFQKENCKYQYLLELYYCAEYNSYLNNAKGTYLLFAHWYLKCSLVATFIVSVLLPLPLILLNSSQTQNMRQKDFENTVIIRTVDSLSNYPNRKIEFDSVKITMPSLNNKRADP